MLRPDWLSRSLTSITKRLSQRAAGSEPGAGNGTRAVSFQLSEGQPGLYSFVLLAIKEQSSSRGETRAAPASRGWHEGGTAPLEDAVTPLAPRIWGWQHPGAARWTRPRPLGTQPGWGRNACAGMSGDTPQPGAWEGAGAEMEPPHLS